LPLCGVWLSFDESDVPHIAGGTQHKPFCDKTLPKNSRPIAY
jgi:hypothetical protein